MATAVGNHLALVGGGPTMVCSGPIVVQDLGFEGNLVFLFLKHFLPMGIQQSMGNVGIKFEHFSFIEM